MYICIIATIANLGRIFIHYKDRFPEAICCCLQTCCVNIVLLVMCCMCTFIVTSADISQLWVYSNTSEQGTHWGQPCCPL